MATNRQATARPLEREPEAAPVEDARRRWVRVTSQMDDSAPAPADSYGEFEAPPRARRPPPAPPTEQLTYSPAPGGSMPFAQQRAQQAPTRAHSPVITGDRMRLAGLIGAGLVGILALYVVLSALFSFLQTKMDDIQYGRPRTTHLDAYVGHAGEQPGQPSHFIAMNLNRRIVVIELPGGDTKDASTITGPYLFGDDEDLTPVKLSSEDVNGDGAADLILNVKNEELIYINDKAKNSFHLLTPDERAKLPAAAGTTTTGAPAGSAQP